MNVIGIILLSLLGCIVYTHGALPYATFWGTTSCDKWVSFDLMNYNPNSGDDYLSKYGLSDITTSTGAYYDVTIVGLYFADDDTCQKNIKLQEKLRIELAKEKIYVNNVALNYYAPESCAQDTTCDNYWYYYYNWWWWYYLQSDCYEYTAGCAPDDDRLKYVNWQFLLSNGTTMPIFQDTDWEDAWENFGGNANDLFIYDNVGRLYSYVCTSSESSECEGYSATAVIANGLSDSTGYYKIKDLVREAAKDDGDVRCANFEDDYRDFYYWYYHDDDQYYRSIDDDYDDDFDDKTSASSTSGIERTYHKHNHHTENFSMKIPKWGWAIVVIASVGIIAYSVFYYRKMKQQRQTLRYSALAINDPDTLNELQAELEGSTLTRSSYGTSQRNNDDNIF